MTRDRRHPGVHFVPSQYGNAWRSQKRAGQVLITGGVETWTWDFFTIP